MKINPLVDALMEENWDEAEFQSLKARVFVARKVEIDNFFDDFSSVLYPLHVAVRKDAPKKIIENLINEHPDAAMTGDSKYKRLPLHLAAMEGASPKVFLALLKAFPQSAKAQDRLGRLPLHYACKASKNSAQNTRYLLKAYGKGALKSDLQGYTPLHVACRCEASLEVIRMLMRVAPGMIHAKTLKGSTPIECAALTKDGNPNVVQIMERYKEAPLKNPDEIFELGSLGGSSVSSFKSTPTAEESVRSNPTMGSVTSDMWSDKGHS